MIINTGMFNRSCIKAFTRINKKKKYAQKKMYLSGQKRIMDSYHFFPVFTKKCYTLIKYFL